MNATTHHTQLTVQFGQILDSAIAQQALASEIVADLATLPTPEPLTDEERLLEDAFLSGDHQDRSFACQMLVDRNKRSREEWNTAQQSQPITMVRLRMPHRQLNMAARPGIESRTPVHAKCMALWKQEAFKLRVEPEDLSTRTYVTGSQLELHGFLLTRRDHEVWATKPRGSFLVTDKIASRILRSLHPRLSPSEKRSMRNRSGLDALWSLIAPMTPTRLEALVVPCPKAPRLTPQWCEQRLRALGEWHRIGPKRQERLAAIEAGMATDSKGRSHSTHWKVVSQEATPPEVAAYLEYLGDIQSGRLDPWRDSYDALDYEAGPGDHRLIPRAEDHTLDPYGPMYERLLDDAEAMAWKDMDAVTPRLSDPEEDVLFREEQLQRFLPAAIRELEELAIDRQLYPRSFLEERPDDGKPSFDY